MTKTLLLALFAGLPLLASGQYVSPIKDTSYGRLLPGISNCTVWWCEATYKVGRERVAPTNTSGAVQIAAARNEYEPFQIVLRPSADLSNVTVSVSDFVLQGGSSNVIFATNVEICLVEYVPVLTNSDAYGTNGLHPDPLPPLTGPFDAVAGSNQPVWFTVYVPKDAPAGVYAATVTIQADELILVPVRLRVFKFALPDTTHTRTAYYVDVGPYWAGKYEVSDWHLLTTTQEMRLVWDLYMQNYRKHRVAPYSAQYYSLIEWGLTNGQFTIDYSAFDEAMTRYLDEFGFNAFNLMGHKTPVFPTTLGGYKQFTPEYCELFARLMGPIMAHLREKGWAEKAYCYWFDEPSEPTNQPFVISGMDALEKCAPGLSRLITVNFDPPASFDGRIDTWVTVLGSSWLSLVQSRKSAGEDSWWYVCTGPTAPLPNNFIDHPALNHRIRFWMAEKFGVTGDLCWATAYWHYNPWTTTTYHVTGRYNGDGVLLYPPTKTPSTTPQLVGPINSLRFELIREGLEDYEYFWLLKQELQQSLLRLGPDHPAVVEGNAALQAALALVPSVDVFEDDPRVLYTVRQRVAEAIEALDDGAPFIVSQPVSRAVSSGGSTTVRIEALGWPLPLCQWRLNGTNLSGATNAVLALTNISPLQTGAYTVVASNSVGVVTSTVAQIEGYWSELPRIVCQPSSLVRCTGSRAVFSVAAVSTNQMSYTWQFNGSPLNGGSATNTTLTLTNLSLSQAGDYSVVISNVAGVAASSTARLVVLLSSTNATLVSAGDLWRYHDSGVDLGTAWRDPAYDDSAWSQGQAPLGYGNGNEATVVGGESTPDTVYFRQTFQILQLPLPVVITGMLQRDDGAVVYMNGMEVFRNNLPTGTVTYATSASGLVNGQDEGMFLTFSVPPGLLQLGTNVLAVEVHQNTNDTAQSLQAVALWSFDETNSPWNDSMGTNTFTATGSHVVASIGKISGCASNNGSTTEYLRAADSPELSYSGPFTVGGWFAWGASSSEAICLQKAGEFKLSYTGTTINRYRFEVNGTVVQNQTGGTTAGQWRFVVAWYDGTNASIQMDNGTVYSTPASAPTNTTNPLVALKKGDSNGGIAADEVFLYKRILAPSERSALFYNQPLPNPTDLSFNLTLNSIVSQLPVLLSQPESLARYPGQSAAFTTTVAGGTPVTRQWFFNGIPITGATNDLLFLNSVSLDDVGAYTLAVSNIVGTVTSSPATLGVIAAPQLQACRAVNGSGFFFEVPACGVPLSVQVSTNLVDWSELFSLPPAFSATNLLDSTTSNVPARFYRLRLNL